MVNLEVFGLPKLEGETRHNWKQLAADVMKLVDSVYGIESIDDAHRKCRWFDCLFYESNCLKQTVPEMICPAKKIIP